MCLFVASWQLSSLRDVKRVELFEGVHVAVESETIRDGRNGTHSLETS
jgi:predicted RNA methylase